MKWSPWKRRNGAEHPDPDTARADLEAIRAQRPKVEALTERLREHVVHNHFAENVFKLGRKL